MPEKYIQLQSELYQFFIKIAGPALMGVGIKLAIEMKKNNTKLSAFNVCTSMIIGVGMAYILSGIITNIFCYDEGYLSKNLVPGIIALIAMISEKIGSFLLYRFRIDIFFTSVIDSIFSWISRNIKLNDMILFENVKTTVVGLAFLIIWFLYRSEFTLWFNLVLIGIGIVLLFAKDQLPYIIKKIINKYFSK